MLLGLALAAGLLAPGRWQPQRRWRRRSGIGSMGSAGMADAHGLAAAFVLDSLVLSRVDAGRVTTRAARAAPVQRTVGVRSVGEGLRMVWRDVPLRLCFIYWGTVSLFIGGSMQVAIPVLAQRAARRFHAGPAAGRHGAGTLLGMGARPPSARVCASPASAP
jgi:hypothetical protein